jgi:DNA polymerase III epsilon subunit family exonuclease
MYDYSKKFCPETICAFDFETTGLHPDSCKAVELGASKVVAGKIVRWSRLVNPGIKIPEEASNIHGIKSFMLKNEPKFVDIIDEFLDFVGDRALVAHNAIFDVGFLAVEMQRARRKLPDIPVFDTLAMSRHIHPHMSSHKLMHVYSECFGLGALQKIQEGAHRAANDSVACLRVALKMCRKWIDKNPEMTQFRHLPWAKSPTTLTTHMLGQNEMTLDRQFLAHAFELDQCYVIYESPRSESETAFGRPTAFLMAEQGRRSKDLVPTIVIDHTDGSSIGIPIETIVNIEAC